MANFEDNYIKYKNKCLLNKKEYVNNDNNIINYQEGEDNYLRDTPNIDNNTVYNMINKNT